MSAVKKTPHKQSRGATSKAVPIKSDEVHVHISGPAEHVTETLSRLTFRERLTIALCQEIALKETGKPNAELASKLGALDMKSPDSRKNYAQKCSLRLAARTGHLVNPDDLPQNEGTEVQDVSDAMYAHA